MRRQRRSYGIENAPGTRDGLCGLVCIDADFSSMIADAAQAHTQTEIAPSLGRPSFGLYEIAVNGGVDGSVFRGRSVGPPVLWRHATSPSALALRYNGYFAA